jgi:hypothetical protein
VRRSYLINLAPQNAIRDLFVVTQFFDNHYLVDNSSGKVAMASFFDLKARKEAAAANGASSSKAPPPKENNRLQPWVEK